MRVSGVNMHVCCYRLQQLALADRHLGWWADLAGMVVSLGCPPQFCWCCWSIYMVAHCIVRLQLSRVDFGLMSDMRQSMHAGCSFSSDCYASFN